MHRRIHDLVLRSPRLAGRLVKDVRASVAFAVFAVLAVALGASLGACTSGATPNCEGGVCGYDIAETGPEEGGAGPEGSALDTGSPEEDAPVDATGQ
jgi:hypothetical protein